MAEVVDYNAIGNVLFVFLVLSIVFEAALSPIFNWSGFKPYDGKGLKTPIMLVLAFLIFWKFDLDIITDLLIAMGKLKADTPTHFMGQVMTAFLIAGGNDAIRQIYIKLGIRIPKPPVETTVKP